MLGPRYTECGVDSGFAKSSANGHIVNILGFVGTAVSLITT